MNTVKKLLTSDISQYLIANAIFSLSSFAVNLCLPFLLDPELFNGFIYVFQMVIFMTSALQIGIIIGLYKFHETNAAASLSIYYIVTLLLFSIYFLFSLFNKNPLIIALKLDLLNYSEQIFFALSVIVSNIFLYNKGVNVKEKNYSYMLRIAVTAFIIRLCFLLLLNFIEIKSICLLLSFFFILPFVQDIRDYLIHLYRHVRFNILSGAFVRLFLLYSFKVWCIGILFIISERIFLISIKNINESFTASIAFATGFIGIISLFISTFTNYFLSTLSTNRIEEIKTYTKQLKKLFVAFFVVLIAICFIASYICKQVYPQLDPNTPTILFIVLFKTGVITYLGMYSLLSKTFNLLNLEITLNILRIIIIYLLCTIWQPQNLLIWYGTVMFVIPLPELIISITINNKIHRYAS